MDFNCDICGLDLDDIDCRHYCRDCADEINQHTADEDVCHECMEIAMKDMRRRRVMAGEVFQKQTNSKYDMRTLILTLREYEEAITELEPFLDELQQSVQTKKVDDALQKFVDLAKQIKEKK